MMLYGLGILLFPIVVLADSDAGLNTVQIITKHGYPCENHQIITEDGFILTYQRIPHGKNKETNHKTVLIMHGIISSGADFVNMGVNRSLGYLLADKGYDVWLANARGTGWSRNHTHLNPRRNPKQYSDYSFHEIGYYDLPAAIDYILKLKKQDSLYYIGYSQGGTSFFVMSSTRPEYNKKVKLAVLLAASSYMSHIQGPVYKLFSQYSYMMEDFASFYGMYEIPIITTLNRILPTVCSTPQYLNLCLFLYYFAGGNNLSQLDPAKLPVLLTNIPSHTSFKQFLHYAQLMKSGQFGYYDYGSKKNKRLYGSKTPPKYNFSKMTAPIILYYGKSDLIVDYRDVLKASKDLPNVIKTYKIPDERFSHFDYLFANDVRELVYEEVIKDLETYP